MGRLAVDLLLAQVEDEAVPPFSTIRYVIVDPATTGICGAAQGYVRSRRATPIFASAMP